MQALRDDVIVKPVYQERIGKLIIPGASKFGKNAGRGEFQLYHGTATNQTGIFGISNES